MENGHSHIYFQSYRRNIQRRPRLCGWQASVHQGDVKRVLKITDDGNFLKGVCGM